MSAFDEAVEVVAARLYESYCEIPAPGSFDEENDGARSRWLDAARPYVEDAKPLLVAEAESERGREARGFSCTNCHRAVPFESRLPGLQCALCPHCRHPLQSAERRQRERAEQAEKQLAELREALEEIKSYGNLTYLGQFEVNAREMIVTARKALATLNKGEGNG